MSPRPTRTLGRGRRLFGGYGPLAGLVLAVLLIVTLIPTIAPEREVQRVAAGHWEPGTAPGETAAGPGGPTAPRSPPAPARRQAPTPAATGPARPGTRRAARAGGVDPDGDEGGEPPGVAGPCADRTVQVLGDTYSPPCIAWPTGKDNGGATYRGVTKDKIRIGFRLPVEDIRDYQSVISQLTGGKGDSIPIADRGGRAPHDRGTSSTYFKRNFQFYGRKLELVEWKGKGSVFNEIVGAGQEAANADAIKAAKELQGVRRRQRLHPALQRRPGPPEGHRDRRARTCRGSGSRPARPTLEPVPGLHLAGRDDRRVPEQARLRLPGATTPAGT